MLTKHNGIAVLKAIGRRSKPVTITELETKTYLSRYAIRAWLDRLEFEEKLIVCERPYRGVPYNIRLTEQGQQELSRL